MDVSRFFDYPEASVETVRSDALVFLETADKDDWLRLIDHCLRLPFRTGEQIIRQGERSQSLYIVAEGELETIVFGRSTRHPVRLAHIPAKSVFGELAFFDGKPRSATVRALSDGELLELTVQNFEVLAARDARLARMILFDLGRMLSMRLRATTDVLSQANR